MQKYLLKYRDHNIQVYKIGNGDISIMLIHGAGLDSAMLSWKEVMEELADKYTVYAVDLLGYGRSDKPKNLTGSLFYKYHTEALESVIEQLKLEKFVLSGLSMGGAISIGYALKHPEKILALIPVDSWGLVKKMPLHNLYFWYVNTSITQRFYKWIGKYRWMAKWSIHYSLIGDKAKISDELIDELCNLCKEENAEIPIQDYQRSSITRAGTIPDYTEYLCKLEMPVLFINGEKDSLVKLKNVNVASKAVKNGQIHIMKGCKHWSQKERPKEYAEVVKEFIDKNLS